MNYRVLSIAAITGFLQGQLFPEYNNVICGVVAIGYFLFLGSFLYTRKQSEKSQ